MSRPGFHPRVGFLDVDDESGPPSREEGHDGASGHAVDDGQVLLGGGPLHPLWLQGADVYLGMLDGDVPVQVGASHGPLADGAAQQHLQLLASEDVRGSDLLTLQGLLHVLHDTSLVP